MSKLDDIRTDLDAARKLVRKAGNTAKEAGDLPGAKDCSKVADKVDELHGSFSKDKK